MNRLLGQLDAALTGFVQRLATTDAGRQVVVLVYSPASLTERVLGADADRVVPGAPRAGEYS